MKIKRINEFEEINEGILSNLFSGVKDLFTSRKGKIEAILKKIKEARKEEVANTISIEKEINSLEKDNSPEYRFSVTNLRRQSRTYSAIKSQEINYLFKEAKEIMENDPKLEAFFASEVSKIEMETKETLLKNLRGLSDSGYLRQINDEFENLVRDSNKKSELYDRIKDMPSYMPSTEVPDSMSNEVVDYINISSNKESSSIARSLDDNQLEKYHIQVKDFFFDLEEKYSEAMERIKRERKIGEKQGDESYLSTLQNHEMNIKYHLRKSIERLKSKSNILEKELKNRRYAGATN